jgi:hypothetical protein
LSNADGKLRDSITEKGFSSVAQGQPGADSSSPVTASLIQSATDFYGATPAFWGRYFTSVNTAGSVEYRHAVENQPLNAAGIRLLPIARQTANVDGSLQQGIEDGVANARDFITTFDASFLSSQGEKFYMFLDVEGSPSLSPDYFTGWALGLAEESASSSNNLSRGSVGILPCLYATQGDAATWVALAAAQAAGVRCMGVWIARYFSGNCEMGEWSDLIVTPAAPDPFPWPILAWQYAGNCLDGAIDCSQTNPNIDAQGQLLDFLVLPPANG